MKEPTSQFKWGDPVDVSYTTRPQPTKPRPETAYEMHQRHAAAAEVRTKVLKEQGRLKG